jgi:hypothetical protein
VWTHWFAVFLVAAEALVLAWRRPDARRGLALALAGMAALVAPIVALFAEQAGGAARSDWIVTNSLGSRLEQVVRQFAMGPDVPRTALEAVGLALAAAGVAAGLLAAWRRPEWRGLVAVAALALAAPLVLAVAGADRFLMRNVLAVWPLVAALAALGLVRARAVPLVALVVVSVATVLWTQTDWRYENPDWAGLTRSGALPARAAAFAALPATDALVAEHYLGARPAAGSEPAPVFWIVAEPARNGTRDARPPAGAAPAYPGLVLRADRTWHGFRVLGYTAQSPTPPAIGTLSQPVFGQPPVLLVGG